MAHSRLQVSWVIEGSGFWVLGYLRGHDGSAMQQPDLSTITYATYDVNRPSVEVDSGSVTIADCVFDSLQTGDARWDVDETGFNFAWPAPVTACPVGGKTYRIQFVFTPASGAVFNEYKDVKTRQIYGR